MKTSFEIRWFYNQLPAGIDLSKLRQDVSKQTDWYLVSANDHSGLKIRNNKIEFKLLVESQPATSFSENICGSVEKWAKFKPVFSDSNDVPYPELLESTGWVKIVKTRYLEYYSLENEIVEIVDEATYKILKKGGQFEITNVMPLESEWWTIGYEVFGEGVQSLDILSSVMKKSFIYDQIKLYDARSFSYPAWLKRNFA